MKIAVLVKQVTDTRETIEAKVNADGVIDRNSLPAICNPDDLNALEQALRLKDRLDECEIVLISMGPQRAEEVLREGIYRGADKGVLLSDRRFAGADTLATSYALAMALRKDKPRFGIGGTPVYRRRYGSRGAPDRSGVGMAAGDVRGGDREVRRRQDRSAPPHRRRRGARERRSACRDDCRRQKRRALQTVQRASHSELPQMRNRLPDGRRFGRRRGALRLGRFAHAGGG